MQTKQESNQSNTIVIALVILVIILTSSLTYYYFNSTAIQSNDSKTISSLQTEINNLSTEVQNLQSNNISQTTEINSLQQQITSDQQQISTLQTNVSEMAYYLTAYENYSTSCKNLVDLVNGALTNSKSVEILYSNQPFSVANGQQETFKFSGIPEFSYLVIGVTTSTSQNTIVSANITSNNKFNTFNAGSSGIAVFNIPPNTPFEINIYDQNLSSFSATVNMIRFIY